MYYMVSVFLRDWLEERKASPIWLHMGEAFLYFLFLILFRNFFTSVPYRKEFPPPLEPESFWR